MAKRKFSKTQFGFMAILWVLLVGFILKYAENDNINDINVGSDGVYTNLQKSKEIDIFKTK